MHKVDHRMEDVEIALVIAVVDVTAGMKILREDMSVFINGAVLDDCPFAFADHAHLVEATVQKIYLQMKCPSRHIFIKIAEVRIVFNRLVQRSPAIMLCQLFS